MRGVQVQGVKGALAATLLAVAAVGLLSACGSEELETHAPIVAEAAWNGPERLQYDLLQRDDLEGTCVLETEPGIEPGVTEVRRLCRDAAEGRYEDNGYVRLDSATLRPITARRVNSDLQEGTSRHFETTYLPAEGRVQFVSKQFEAGEDAPSKQLSATRDLPAATDNVPEPAWYDDEELLWLVRSIPLREGFEGNFTNVNASTGRVFGAEVTVEEAESVEVPAGAFTTWKVRIATSTITNIIWVEQAAPHRVIRAQIERLTYELTATE